MHNVCAWQKFFEDNDWESFVLWILIFIQTAILPIVFWTCCSACLGHTRKRRHSKAKIEQKIRERNFRENKKLLRCRKMVDQANFNT